MSADNRRGLVIIIDGLGDVPNPLLQGKTPLEAAATPTMDRWAASGVYGLVDPIVAGAVPNTHSGTGRLMGMLPGQDHLLSRGPVEAAGAGVPLKPGDVACRANFATLEKTGQGFTVTDRRAGRITSGTDTLAAAVDGMDLGDGVTARLQATDQHRAVLVLSGPGLSASISKTDPGDVEMPALQPMAVPKQDEAVATAKKLNDFLHRAHDILHQHPLNRERVAAGLLPANGLLTRGAGQAFELKSLPVEKSMKVATVAGCNTVVGLSRILGFDVIYRDDFTADRHTNIAGKIEQSMQALEHNDLVFVHFKAPDLFSHDRDAAGKQSFIEAIERALQQLDGEKLSVLISADHTTNSITGVHTEAPVPSLLCHIDPATKPQPLPNGFSFGEIACAEGTFKRCTSHELFSRMLTEMRY